MLELRVAAAPAGEEDVKTLDGIIDGLRVEIKQAGLSSIENGTGYDIDHFDLFVLDKEGARCKVLVRWGDKTWTWVWLGDLLDDHFVMQQLLRYVCTLSPAFTYKLLQVFNSQARRARAAGL